MKLILLLGITFAGFAVLSAQIDTLVKILEIFPKKFDDPSQISKKVKVLFSPTNNEIVHFPLEHFKYLITEKKFNQSLPTVMYIHGWLENGELDESTIAIRRAYLDVGDHNVLTLDWSHYSQSFLYYTKDVGQEKIIAETVAEELRELFSSGYEIELFHIVGHSFGGHMAGKIGRHIQKISNGLVKIPRIYALDPAGPGFEDHPSIGFEPIKRTDADYVQIIHTNGGQLGMQQRTGTVDFYPNGGSKQPGCNIKPGPNMIESLGTFCNHFRSWHFYQQSVRDNFAFPAIRCNSWDDFMSNGTCFKKDIVYMGLGADLTQTGKYFLQTNANMFNLSKGLDGLKASKVLTTKLPVPGVPENESEDDDNAYDAEYF